MSQLPDVHHAYASPGDDAHLEQLRDEAQARFQHVDSSGRLTKIHQHEKGSDDCTDKCEVVSVK